MRMRQTGQLQIQMCSVQYDSAPPVVTGEVVVTAFSGR